MLQLLAKRNRSKASSGSVKKKQAPAMANARRNGSREGVAQLLTPVPQVYAPGASGTNSEQDPRKSYSFSGIQNTSRQGVPVPIVYGETLVGSVVISAGIDTVQVTG